MKRIESLTKQQQARFPEFVEKWERIGLSTEPVKRDKVVAALGTLFGIVKKPAPPVVTICTSPLAACLVRAILSGIPSVSDSVRDSVSASVSASVRDSVSDSVRDSVRASVRDSVRDSVSASVSDSVSDSVSASVRDSVSASAWYWYSFGQFEAWWLSYWDYMREVLNQDTSLLKGNEEFCRVAGFSLLFWKFALVSQRPTCVHLNHAKRLHRDGGPAIAFPDGWAVWALNGIRMSQDYVESPAERIPPETVLRETNADIRRELIRKVGVERMLAKLPHRSLEKRDNYELLSVNLSEEVRDARFLRMLNPSIGVWHLEGVAPECKTVAESLNWRNQQWHEDAEVLT